MVPRLRSGCDEYFIARAGYGVYTKAVYAAIYVCAKKAMSFTATKSRVIVHHDLLWPAAAARIRSKNGRNSQMIDFAIKTSAKALPTSKMLQSRYGETIIDDITCLNRHTGAPILRMPCHTARKRQNIHTTGVQNCKCHGPKDKENRKTGEIMLEGHEKKSIPSPLMELTCVGFLTPEFRQQMLHMGLTETQVERIGKETANHALQVTYNLMWKVRNAAMKATGRTMSGYLAQTRGGSKRSST
jgi:hypothetical protein